jgi:formylmethanofuran dehydrogenase subunit B
MGRKEMTTDKDKTPVAENLITMCTKCKMELSHVVIAHNTKGVVTKVKCHTCGSEHKYSPAKKTSRKTAKTSKKGGRTKKADYAEEFQKLAEKYKEKEPVHYSMSGSFKPEDVIDHQNFGMGIVMNVSYQKMEVAFPDGLRILVCDR